MIDLNRRAWLLLLLSGCVLTSLSAEEPSPAPSFRNDVLPVLSKVGCNSGACHGALAGKGGFRLSLRGYDPRSDYFNLTRQALGRRVELSDPGRSLVLTKPTGAVSHKGGVRIDVDSEEYEIIANWLRHGAPAPGEDDAQVVDVEIHPASGVEKKGAVIPLKVLAKFDDGTSRDVTRWARFSSADDTVANVDQHGNATVIGHGEGAITAWYSSRIGIARVTSPFPHEVDNSVYEQSGVNNFIDELVLEKLEQLNLAPSPPADDRVFVRRVFLDTIGVLPTAAEVESYLLDDSTDKKERLIDSLLARPEFVDYWTYQWSDVLLINGRRLRPKAVEAFYKWVRSHVKANTPWDEFVRQVLVATGGSIENGATNFFALHQDPENMAENASQAFLGLSIGCAKCHNHPLEKWTNDQYYAFANLFARVRGKGWGGDPRNGDGVRTLFIADKGELVQPSRGRPQPPTPLDGEPLSFDYDGDRRVPLAEWLIADTNPYFARSITNRVWAKYFGVGLVERADDMRLTNPASNEKLLSEAASYLVANGYDLKKLMRAILLSATYARSSQALPENRDESRFYSRYYPRRLMAEVLLDAMSDVTDVPTEFKKIAFSGADVRDTEFYKDGARAIQLYDSAVVSYFLKSFGRNDRAITCECQRSDEPSMVQVLHISNGDTLNGKLQAADNWLGELLEKSLSDKYLVQAAYERTLARKPTASEWQAIEKAFGDYQPAERRALYEDLLWGLMSSREFLFNH